jgi:t-SNARE complex subunit (syntaxin)
MPRMNLDDSEAVSKWRKEQESQLAKRQAEWKKKHEETLVKARKEIDTFYAEYNQKKEKSKKANREAESKSQTEQAQAKNVWERVTTHIDFNATIGQTSIVQKDKDVKDKKAGNSAAAAAVVPEVKRDVGRFKSMLLQLKNDPKAPGNAVATR